MEQDDPSAFHEKPQHAGVELTDVAQLEKVLRRALWTAVRDDTGCCVILLNLRRRREIVRIALLQVIKKFPHRASSRLFFIEFYCKVHRGVTSNLMYQERQTLINRLKFAKV
jgi:hypothetical protein